MDDQVHQVVAGGLALLGRLAKHGLARQHHVAQRARLPRGGDGVGTAEGQHVRRPVLAAVIAVEPAQQRVIGQHHRDLQRAARAGGRGQMAEQPLGGTAHQRPGVRHGHTPARIASGDGEIQAGTPGSSVMSDSGGRVVRRV